MANQPTIPSIRKLLNEILVTDADFDAFCLDNFPKIRARFTTGMERVAKQNILLESVSTPEILARLRESYPEKLIGAEKLLVYRNESSPAILLSSSESKNSSKLVTAIVIFVMGIILTGAFSFLFALMKFGRWIYGCKVEPDFWKIVLAIVLYMVDMAVIFFGCVFVEDLLEKNTLFVSKTGEKPIKDLNNDNVDLQYYSVLSNFWLRLPPFVVILIGLLAEMFFLGYNNYKDVIIGNILLITISLPTSWIMYLMESRNKYKGNRWVIENFASWDDRISTLLQSEGQIQLHNLTDVPKYAVRLLLQKYALNHLEETVFLKEHLAYRKPQAVQDLIKDLSDLEHVSGRNVLMAHDLRVDAGKLKYNKRSSGTLLGKFSILASHLCKALRTSNEAFNIDYTDHRFYYTMISTSFIFEGTKLPENLPFFILIGKNMTDQDFDSLRRILTRTNQRTILLALLFCGEDEARKVQIKIDSTIRQTFACDIIIISRNDLIRIIASNDSQKLLRKHIIKQIDIDMISPFVIVGPTPNNIFFGRETELRVITDQARTISHAIIGGRRVGKSSLLSRLHNARLPSAGFLTLYHDCSMSYASTNLLDANILEWKPEIPAIAPLTFRALLSMPVQELPKMPLVLLLDEADKLVPSERATGWPFFNALRALANSGRGQVVLSGERTLREALRDPQSPLFNFANEMLLGPLDFRAVEELVTRPMKQLDIELVDEEQVVQCIWDFTSGHPNVVQRLCRRLLDRLSKQDSRKISLSDVNAVIKDPKFQEEDFLNTYWERATPLEQIISILFAQKNNPYRLRAVIELLHQQGLDPDPEIVKAALDRLVDLRSILKQSQEGYEFSVSSFPMVLSNTTTSEDLLIVLKSKYLKNANETAD